MATPSDIEILSEFLPAIRVTQCSQIAILALVVYDIIITMDNEIYFFWDNTFSVTNLVFVLLRYCAALKLCLSIWESSLHVDTFVCIFSQWGINLLDWIILICMDYILYLRVRALFSLDRKSRTTTRLLFAMLVIDGTVTLGVVIDGLIVEKVSAFALPGNISQCGIQATAPVVQKYLYWGIVLIYQTIAVGLASYKAMYLRKTLGFRGIQLVNTIITDQNIYITFVLACSITNIFATLTEHKGIVRESVLTVFYVLGGAHIFAIFGHRMLVHLKQTAEENKPEGRSFVFRSHVNSEVFRRISTRHTILNEV